MSLRIRCLACGWPLRMQSDRWTRESVDKMPCCGRRLEGKDRVAMLALIDGMRR